MTAVYSMPDAFSAGECDCIIAAISAAPSKDARLVGKTKDHSLRTAQLVWMDDVDGLGWAG